MVQAAHKGIPMASLSHYQVRRARAPVAAAGRTAADAPPAQVIRWHMALLANTAVLPCRVIYTSDINSCHGWCTHHVPRYDALANVQGMLHGRGHMRQRCRAAGLGFLPPEPGGAVQAVWHIRTGDTCIECSSSYYRRTWKPIRDMLGGRRVKLTFESQHPLVCVNGKGPWCDNIKWPMKLMFKKATFSHNSTLHETVCRFLTADILLMTGSSLPAMVSAFADPWEPIVIEERRKGPSWPGHMHYNSRDSAVLLDRGRVMSHTPEELAKLFDEKLPQPRPLNATQLPP